MKIHCSIKRLTAFVALGALVSSSTLADTNPKKGIGLSTNRYADSWYEMVDSLNVSWHYSWGPKTPKAGPADVEFVPMVWSYRRPDAKFEAKLDAIREQQPEVILGYNEPDGKKQANMSVELALEGWPYLEELDIRLGSPGPVHAHKEWLQEFMKEAEARDYRVDFICVHWYGGRNAQGFINRLKEIHEMYDRLIWITEFAPADWSAKTPQQNRHSPEEVLAFMKEVLPMLDDLDFVERYAWFSGRLDRAPLWSAALFDADGNLTELGRYYSAH